MSKSTLKSRFFSKRFEIKQNTAKIEAEFQIALISSWDELFSKGEH